MRDMTPSPSLSTNSCPSNYSSNEFFKICCTSPKSVTERSVTILLENGMSRLSVTSDVFIHSTVQCTTSAIFSLLAVCQ